MEREKIRKTGLEENSANLAEHGITGLCCAWLSFFGGRMIVRHQNDRLVEDSALGWDSRCGLVALENGSEMRGARGHSAPSRASMQVCS